MNYNSSPRSLGWPLVAGLMLLISMSLFFESHKAAQESGFIPVQSKSGPMTPAHGYAASAFVGAFGLALLIRWIQLVRRPAPDGEEKGQEK